MLVRGTVELIEWRLGPTLVHTLDGNLHGNIFVDLEFIEDRLFESLVDPVIDFRVILIVVCSGLLHRSIFGFQQLPVDLLPLHFTQSVLVLGLLELGTDALGAEFNVRSLITIV